VTKTGAFVLNENEDISTLKALALAGGLSRTAAPASARVLRRSPGTPQRQDIPVNLSSIMKNRASDLPLQPEDILYVPGSLTKKISLRSIEAAFGVGSSLAVWRVAQ
jgi:polysaccharide biosynthesis/export protein